MEATHYDWRTNLILTFSVIITVVAALLLAQLDEWQSQPPTPTFAAVARVTATPSRTALPFTPEATVTPTDMPLSVTAPPSAVGSATATPVPVVPTCTNQPADWLPHTVVAGESLMSLAAAAQANVAKVMKANCLLTGQLEPGMIIYLPSQPQPTRPPCGPPLSWPRYTVQRGDTLFSLSRKTGTTVDAIMWANCLVNSYLVAGRKIFLPVLPLVNTPTLPPPTATWTPAPTDTPEPTDTSEPPTATATAVPTTLTPTRQLPTLTPTITATVPTFTATPSVTPTVTATPSPTVTTASPTATASPTTTPTASSTPLPTATATPSPAATPTATHTPTATATGLFLPTFTPTVTGTPLP